MGLGTSSSEPSVEQKMGYLLLSLSCFRDWADDPNGSDLLRGTLRHLVPRVDGFVIPLDYHELEDLVGSQVRPGITPTRLRAIPQEIIHEMWQKPQTSIALPPITDLVEGAEVALADIINQVAERMGVFRFHLPITSVVGVDLLATLLDNLSPYISITVKELIANASVQAELSPLLKSEASLSYAVQGRYWTEGMASRTEERLYSFLNEHTPQYASLRWSSSASHHRMYERRMDVQSCLVVGSGYRIPNKLVEALPADGSVIVEGYTPVEATPLLAEEIHYARTLCDSLIGDRTPPELTRRAAGTVHRLTSHQVERPRPTLS